MSDQEIEVRPAPPAPDPGAAEVSPARAVYADITSREGERRPIIPVPFQRENLRTTIEQFAGLNWHRARVHGLRLPVYVLAYLFWAIIGVLRVAGRVWRWWQLTEQHWLRNDAAAEGLAKEWMSLHKEAKETRRVRGMILAAVVGALLVTGLLLARFGPWWSWAIAAMAAAVVLARAGHPDGHRIIPPAVVPPQCQPPDPEIITRALGSLGIPLINAALKDGGKITFISDVHRDGPGWGTHLDLPHGVTAGHVIAKRPELASGLRRPLSAVWPEGVPAEHEGRLALWIGFQDLSKGKPPPWPLLKTGQADVFEPVPFGADPRGRPVRVPIFEANWLIGASPGQGKTAAVRALACAVALDPVADLWVHELAGKGDLDLSQVCHRYTSGIDDESIEYAAESARLLRQETERRSGVFKRLKGTGVMPDGKVTRELAERNRSLRPLVAFFDEVQNLFMNPELGKQAAADLAFAIRVGRAMGITVILATQRPNAESVPPIVSGLVICRFCLMVPGQVENDMVLGTSAYKNGYKATLLRPKVDVGLGWLKGSEDGIPQITKTYYLDLRATGKIAVRARAMRERAGVLSGYAAGLDDAPAEARDVLADLLAVFGDDEGMHWGVAADRLAGRFPDRWADATGEAISAQCRGLGVKSVDVRQDATVLKGCRRVAVEQAARR